MNTIQKQFVSAYTVQYFNTTPTLQTQRLHYEDLPLTIVAPKNAQPALQVAGFSSQMVQDMRQPLSASFYSPTVFLPLLYFCEIFRKN